MPLRTPAAALIALLLALAPAGLPAQPSNIRLWRITGMIPEPWADPAAPPPGGLLRAGLAFLDDAVKGPPPLACGHPVYRERAVSLAELFGGRVSEDQAAATAERLGIGAVQPFAFQVVCGATVTSYFWVGPDRLVRVGDAILRIQPHEGDEGIAPDDWVRPITAGFDCDRAATAAERLICSDAGTAKSDREIAERFAALRGEETKESFATVQAAQRAWLRHSRAACGADGALPADETARRDMLSCLGEAYGEWHDAFTALAVRRAGALALEPRLHLLAALAPRRRLDWIAYPWMTGTPAGTAEAFNRVIAAVLAPQAAYLTPQRITEPEADYPIGAWRSYSVHNLDERLVSLLVEGQVYGGGAHEGLIEEAIDVDLQRGRRVGPADFFRPGTPWRAAIAALCLQDLREQLQPAADEGPTLAEVEPVVADPGAWLFQPDHATVHFAVYTVGSFSGGPQEVDLPYAALRPYLRPDAPLPAGAGR
jgi:uncharacterized protein YecT (DUF1311 family)